MEFLNGGFSRVYGHKLESSSPVFVWFSNFFFSVLQNAIRDRLQLSCGFFCKDFLNQRRVGIVFFSLKFASRRDCEWHGPKDWSLLFN
jgi:hypothetical protein